MLGVLITWSGMCRPPSCSDGVHIMVCVRKGLREGRRSGPDRLCAIRCASSVEWTSWGLGCDVLCCLRCATLELEIRVAGREGCGW